MSYVELGLKKGVVNSTENTMRFIQCYFFLFRWVLQWSVIFVEGGVLGAASYRVVYEKEDIVTTQQLTDAFCCLVSSFDCFDMNYPENAKKFYKFVEVVTLNMDVNPTRVVRSILAKLVWDELL